MGNRTELSERTASARSTTGNIRTVRLNTYREKKLEIEQLELENNQEKVLFCPEAKLHKFHLRRLEFSENKTNIKLVGTVRELQVQVENQKCQIDTLQMSLDDQTTIMTEFDRLKSSINGDSAGFSQNLTVMRAQVAPAKPRRSSSAREVSEEKQLGCKASESPMTQSSLSEHSIPVKIIDDSPTLQEIKRRR